VPLTPELRQLASRVSNWGRWGEDDQRGTLNLVTSEAVQRGARAVRSGRVFSLAIPFDRNGPQWDSVNMPERVNPEVRTHTVNMAFTGDRRDFTTSDDSFRMGSQAATHWDALAHVGYEEQLYNGTPDSVVTTAGAGRLGIEHFGPFATRGVLLDIARVHGVDHFDEAYPISADDLEAAAQRASVAIEAGDAVLVRTGQMHFLRAGDRRRYPCEAPAVFMPVHMIHLRDMGLAQGQLWDLDALAADCEEDGQFDCLLVATPLPLTGAVGAPVAPTAIK
jgi:kynurenine formamidase